MREVPHSRLPSQLRLGHRTRTRCEHLRQRRPPIQSRPSSFHDAAHNSRRATVKKYGEHPIPRFPYSWEAGAERFEACPPLETASACRKATAQIPQIVCQMGTEGTQRGLFASRLQWNDAV